jgi:hypothetical protein
LIETGRIFTRVAWIAREFERQNTNNILYFILKKLLQNVLKRRRTVTKKATLANLESEDQMHKAQLYLFDCLRG